MTEPTADAPPPSAWAWVRRGLLAAFFWGVGCLLWRQVHGMEWALVWASVRAYPPAMLATSVALALASLVLYSTFDLLGRRYTGHRLPTRAVMGVTFVSYVFNLNLGSLVGAFGFRLRLYSRLGLQLGQVSRIVGLSMVTSWLGYLLLAGSLFALHPPALPADWRVGPLGLRVLGAALLALALAYLWLCLRARRRRFRLRGHRIELPSGRMALSQAAMGCANWLLLGGVVYTLMPAGLDYVSVAGVLLLAAMAGVITHVPAGLGVLETVFLTLLSARAPRHELLAALLAYRLIYYLIPLALALVLYIATELRVRRSDAARSA